MSKTKFTPGPWISTYSWEVRDSRGGPELTDEGEILDANGQPVAIIFGHSYANTYGGFNRDWPTDWMKQDGQIHAANAALIASAPDMYAALIAVTEAIGDSEMDAALCIADAAIRKARGES